jgi:peptidoglycan hydrolase CwlO-like protein
MKKRIIPFVTVLILTSLVFVGTVIARQPSEEEILIGEKEQLQQELTSSRAYVDELRFREEMAKIELEQIQSDISSEEATITLLRRKIAIKERKIAEIAPHLTTDGSNASRSAEPSNSEE